jgi:hypothetical protein
MHVSNPTDSYTHSFTPLHSHYYFTAHSFDRYFIDHSFMPRTNLPLLSVPLNLVYTPSSDPDAVHSVKSLAAQQLKETSDQLTVGLTPLGNSSHTLLPSEWALGTQRRLAQRRASQVASQSEREELDGLIPIASGSQMDDEAEEELPDADVTQPQLPSADADTTEAMTDDDSMAVAVDGTKTVSIANSLPLPLSEIEIDEHKYDSPPATTSNAAALFSAGSSISYGAIFSSSQQSLSGGALGSNVPESNNSTQNILSSQMPDFRYSQVPPPTTDLPIHSESRPCFSVSQSHSRQQTSPPVAMASTLSSNIRDRMHLHTPMSASSDSKEAFFSSSQLASSASTTKSLPTRLIGGLAQLHNSKTFQRKQLLSKKPAAPLFDGTPPKEPVITRGISQIDGHDPVIAQKPATAAAVEPNTHKPAQPNFVYRTSTPAAVPASSLQHTTTLPQIPQPAPRTLFPLNNDPVSQFSTTQQSHTYRTYSTVPQAIPVTDSIATFNPAGAVTAGGVKNLAMRSGPPPGSAASKPPRTASLMSRTEIRANRLNLYRELWPLVQKNGAAHLQSMNLTQLQAIVAGQNLSVSKYRNKAEMLSAMQQLLELGQLKPPLPSSIAGSSATHFSARSSSSRAPFADRISFTQKQDGFDSDEDEMGRVPQSVTKRIKTSANDLTQLNKKSLPVRPLPPLGPMPDGSAFTSSSDLASRMIATPAWVTPSPRILPGVRYTRPMMALSSFLLQAGVEVVVLVDLYMRFRCTHQFALDRLALFKSRDVVPRGARQTLMQLGQSTGILHARVISLLPIIGSDAIGTNSDDNCPPPTPWCVLSMQQISAETNNNELPTFTIFYLDADWAAPTGDPFSRQQLRVFNKASFLLERGCFEQRMSHKWNVGDLFEMSMIMHGEPINESVADGEEMKVMEQPQSQHPLHHMSETRRVGRIMRIGTNSHRKDDLEIQQPPLQSFQVLWLTPHLNNSQLLVYDLVR